MIAPPPQGTVERWCFDYVTSDDLRLLLEPPSVPEMWEADPPPRRIEKPGRPAVLVGARKAAKSPGREALRAPSRRAQLAHTFFHHELQAAELMAWAVLSFPDTPRAFRRGLVGIALDEIRHMRLYRDYMISLGFDVGAFPIRDWFWERVPGSPSPAHFVAAMGIGFEGGNLDHTARFAKRLRAVGDETGAALEERIGEEEIPHVRFAIHWFERFTAPLEFASWARHLPSPLTPLVMRGSPMNRADRERSGLSLSFLDELDRWPASALGS